MIFYFYFCYRCGCLYYAKKRIKKKKCNSCNHTFTFKKAKKVRVNLRSERGATALLKYLKRRKYEEKYLSFNLKDEVRKLAKGNFREKKREVNFKSFN